MSATLRRLVNGLVERHGSATAVAGLIGMSVSAFVRGVRKEGTLSVEHCLRLAETAGESPSTVLRLAGKVEVAAILERLYGTPAAPLDVTDRALLALEHSVKQQLLRLVAGLSAATRKK